MKKLDLKLKNLRLKNYLYRLKLLYRDSRFADEYKVCEAALEAEMKKNDALIEVM